jgi:YD repeat-containing protein
MLWITLQSSYDLTARRTEFTHAGTTTMEYDLAGNLIKRITGHKNTVPNLGAIKYSTITTD